MSQPTETVSGIDLFLRREEEKDLLRFLTCRQRRRWKVHADRAASLRLEGSVRGSVERHH